MSWLFFPETMDFAWTHPSGLKEADYIPGLFSEKLCRLSKKLKIFMCAGLTEKNKRGKLQYSLIYKSGR